MKHYLSLLAPAIAIAMPAHAVDQQLKYEFDELAARANAAIENVNALEQRARATGHSLHPDLLTQRSLVRSAMDDAEESLRVDDSAKLRDQLKRARGLIDKLYKMF